MSSAETELAWAAGFFDGEGSIFVRHTKRHKGGTTGKEYPLTTVEMSVCQTRCEPIERFTAAVGVGRTAGPYKQRVERHAPYWRWNTCGRPSTYSVLLKLWPYLSVPKQEQAHRVWDKLREYRTAKSPVLHPLPEMKERYYA